MIKKMMDDDLIQFITGVDQWEEAIVRSGDRLIAKEYIDDTYVQEILDCVKEHGPYIVLIPGVAMPHATVGAKGVNKTGISLTVFDQEIYFDEEKHAKLFFTVATNDPDQHLENIQNLMELLMDEENLEILMNAKELDDLKKIKEES